MVDKDNDPIASDMDDDDFDDDAPAEGARAQAVPGERTDKADDAVEVLMDLLDHMGLEAEVKIREDGERIVLDVAGKDAGRAIGKKGTTLDALQFLVNKIVNRFPEGRRHVIVDSGDYRERRDEGLISMAQKQAERAVQIGKVVTLQPMSARDRRVVHLSLAKFAGVTTKSQGEGMGRRIQIIPARLKAGGGGRGDFRGGGGGRGGHRGGRGHGGDRQEPVVTTERRRRWDD